MVRVSFEDVTKRFGDVTAVASVNLVVEKGELFFLLGPSGCGKTTLLRMVAGFYIPEEGRILFDDRDVTNLEPYRRNTGMVFQNYALWPHLTVAENVAYGLEVRDLSKDERDRRVENVLKNVQMADYAKRTPNQLSGGQQQRIALARALVIEPDAVLLDEPLSNLDAKLRLEMRDEIRRIHDRVGITMIYVTHDQEEALSMAQRMAVMQRGFVRQVGSPREVYTRPISPFVAGFIGETNFLNARISERGEHSKLETEHGAIIGAGLPEELNGNDVTCSIRPEAVTISEGEMLSGGAIEGVVESVMYLGDTEQYLVKLAGGGRMRVVEWNLVKPKARAGESVTLTFAAEDVIVLPREETE